MAGAEDSSSDGSAAVPAEGVPARGGDSAQLLTEAIEVLTRAARLTRPVLTRDEAASAAGGEPVWVDSGKREPADWADFVAAALAGATANAGGIEAVLAGRPGSWEADHIRHLLTGTVGHEEEYLLEHRTESITVTLHVTAILSGRPPPPGAAPQPLSHEGSPCPGVPGVGTAPPTNRTLDQDRQGPARLLLGCAGSWAASLACPGDQQRGGGDARARGDDAEQGRAGDRRGGGAGPRLYRARG